MPYTKFHGNWQTRSGEGFLRVFTIYGPGSHLDHVTQMSRTESFVPPTHGGSTQNLALNGQAVWEKMFEIANGRRLTNDHCDSR